MLLPGRCSVASMNGQGPRESGEGQSKQGLLTLAAAGAVQAAWAAAVGGGALASRGPQKHAALCVYWIRRHGRPRPAWGHQPGLKSRAGAVCSATGRAAADSPESMTAAHWAEEQRCCDNQLSFL